MKTVLCIDWSLRTVLETLIYHGDGFILAGSGIAPKDIEDFLEYPARKNFHYFIAPEIKEKLELTAWKANTLKALKPDLYIGSDAATVEQARILGVKAAFYRL